MSEQVFICLYLLREDQRKEYLADNCLSFHEILQILKVKDLENRCIAEQKTGYLCDPNVSLHSLGVQNCMRFLVY